MPNYFKVKENGGFKQVEINGQTIEGEGKEGQGNAAEQFVSKTLHIYVEDIKEITEKEYKAMDDEKEEKGIPFNEKNELKCSKCCRNCEAEQCPYNETRCQ